MSGQMMDARNVTRALGGRWHATYGMVRCIAPGHADKSASLRLRDGDQPGRLLVRCYAGCASTEILNEMKRRGLVTGDAGAPTDVGDEIRARRAKEEEKAAKARASAVERIKNACRGANGTIVERYIRNRGIMLNLPPTLRYHPNLRHPETGTDFEGMVALVQGPDRKVCGIHRTLLVNPGRKAPGKECKFSLGPIGGGAVRLAHVAEEMAIAEGIETALSFMQIYGIPTWSALSTAGIEAIVLPPLPAAKVIHLAMDIDKSRAGEKSVRKAAERFEKEGREVRFARPSIGCKDFNDMLVTHGA